MKILCVGPMWRGSNAGALFKAFSRLGYLIEVVDECYHLPLNTSTKSAKILAKITRNFFVADFNKQIQRAFNSFQPDWVLVYKGAFVAPETISQMQSKGVKVFNFYPDVSFHTHGNYLQHTLKLYDFIFTTKTFGVSDMKSQLGIEKSAFIPHGFDPEIHKPIKPEFIPKDFFCDVSFIGTWSPKKERLLSYLMEKLPTLKMNIWGGQWEKSSSSNIKSSIHFKTVFGDVYAAAISASKINLGILSEQVKGASSGDLITSRTFHIPAAGGFMLHERTPESILYFGENQEVGFFETEEELVQQVEKFLNDEALRLNIANNGHLRALAEHSIDNRATRVLEALKAENLI